MKPITLTLKRIPAQPVDLSLLVPNRISGLTPRDIAAIDLATGNQKVRVDEIFELDGDDTENLVIRNSCEKLNFIGKDMLSGSISVWGNAGAYPALGMRGGAVTIHGNVGAWAASGMRDGLLQIKGNAGDFLAAAIPGDRHGMRGGTVLVDGNAGDRVGDHMRRGMVLIKGDAGDYCASRMLAGTIMVLGGVGDSPGFGMRRGTLLLFRAPEYLPATFNDCGEHHLLFLRLLKRHLAGQGGGFVKFVAPTCRVRRFVGDLANNGKGEILLYR